MKTFSDLLVTDQQLDVQLKIRPVCSNGAPGCKVGINGDVLWHGILEQPVTICAALPLLHDLYLKIELYNKIYHSELETAVVIDCIEVDGIDIGHHVQDLITYHNDQQVSNKSLYLGFNGDWEITVPGPFYQWWHRKSGQGWLLQPLKA